MFNEVSSLADTKLELGMVFQNQGDFRKLLKEYAIRKGFTLDYVANDRKRIIAKCKMHARPFRVLASWNGHGRFMLKRLSTDHTCFRNPKNKEVTAE